MNNDKPEGKKRPVLLVPRCETCAKTDQHLYRDSNVARYCRHWLRTVPKWGFCHEHPEVTAHA